ncbi:MAG: hypothetical protein AB8H80_14270 [Planctomycetota bacterium]
MQSEVREIPPAPRRARIQPLLAHRWPMLMIGGTMVTIGGLIAWAMFLQSGGKFSFGPRLAEGPVRVVEGTLDKISGQPRFDDTDWDEAHYSLTWMQYVEPENGTARPPIPLPLEGMCYVPRDRYAAGATVPIEVLLEDKNVHCIVGGVKHIYRQWLYARFWLVVLVVPGALLLLSWLTGVFQLRQVLVHGDVTVGRVLSAQTVRWVLPEMLQVRYEFRDHSARLRQNRHWVRARGSLGTRLRHSGDGGVGSALPVLHDRRLPHWNRMLLANDFLHQPEPLDPELPSGV